MFVPVSYTHLDVYKRQPFSTPPNALVMPAGKYTFMDYVKVGVPRQVIMGLVMVVVIPLFFPFGKA